MKVGTKKVGREHKKAAEMDGDRQNGEATAYLNIAKAM
jgi:hypothetical protein